MMKKNCKLSVFVDTLACETRELSSEAMGIYMRLLHAAQGNGGTLSESTVASSVLHIHTNKWRKVRADLIDKNFLVVLPNEKITVRHLVNDGQTRGVCPQIIDAQMVPQNIHPPLDTPLDTPPDTHRDTPPDTPPVFARKPAEILESFFPSISISNSEVDNKDLSSLKSDDEIFGKTPPKNQSDFGKVFEAIIEAEPNLQIVSTALIHNWLQNGCSPELDIIPTVQRMIKKAGPGAVKSLKYFDAAIQQSKVDRQSSPLQLTPSAKKNNVPSPYKIDQNIDYARGWTGDPSMVIGGLSDARN